MESNSTLLRVLRSKPASTGLALPRRRSRSPPSPLILHTKYQPPAEPEDVPDEVAEIPSSSEDDNEAGFVSGHRRLRAVKSKDSNTEMPSLDMEFTRWREAVVVVCLIFYISDLLLDGWVVGSFIKSQDFRLAWFTGFCMMVPNLYAGYKSLQWYLRAFEVQPNPEKDPRIWLIRVLFFPVSLLLRYYHVLKYGYEARAATKSGNKRLQRQKMAQFLAESAEVAMLRLFIIFLEDAPICVLNLVQVFLTQPQDIDDVGFAVGVVVAKLSCSMTLGVVHYASLTKVAYHASLYEIIHSTASHPPASKEFSYDSDDAPEARGSTCNTRLVASRTSRRELRRKLSPIPDAEDFQKRADFTPLAYLFFYLWQITNVGSRLVLYALFASMLMRWILLLAAIRWVVNTIFILVDVPNMSLANCGSFGGVYLFTFVSTSTAQQYIRIMLYYTLNSIECIAVAVIWWTNEQETLYHVMGFSLLIGSTVTSFFLMLLYYGVAHPNSKDTWGRRWWRKIRNSDAESTSL